MPVTLYLVTEITPIKLIRTVRLDTCPLRYQSVFIIDNDNEPRMMMICAYYEHSVPDFRLGTQGTCLGARAWGGPAESEKKKLTKQKKLGLTKTSET